MASRCRKIIVEWRLQPSAELRPVMQVTLTRHFGCEAVLGAGLLLACAMCLPAQELQPVPQSPRRITTTPSAPKTPNIIVIVADDLGYGDLGCYGQKQIKTPNLDQLAAKGLRFTSFYAGSTICAPSRCSLMTGMNTGHATIRGNTAGAALAAEDITLAQLLQGVNYMTCVVGKWALGDEGSTGLPGDKGFDEFVGYLNQTRAHDYYAPYADRYNTNGGLRRVEFPTNFNSVHGLYFPDQFTKSALNFIRIYQPAWFNNQRPFFLYLPYTLPHANNELGRETGNGMQVPNDKPYSDEAWPAPEKNKAAMITLLDKYVGDILAGLKRYGQDTNTLILFTSDNGPHSEGGVQADFFRSAGPLRGMKRDLYEGGIRVPLIAVWPGRIPAGGVSEEPWAFWDLLPTLAEVAGAKVPKNIDGISFLPTLLGKTQTHRHEYLYWELHENGFKQAVRAGDWKAVRLTAGGPIELYNLAKDIGETNNVAAANPEVVARLEGLLKTARADSPRYPVGKDEAKGSAGAVDGSN
jgi:arylsulfatase A-like enzyme